MTECPSTPITLASSTAYVSWSILPDLWNFHLKFKMGHNDFNEIWGELHSVKPITILTSHHL